MSSDVAHCSGGSQRSLSLTLHNCRQLPCDTIYSQLYLPHGPPATQFWFQIPEFLAIALLARRTEGGEFAGIPAKK